MDNILLCCSPNDVNRCINFVFFDSGSSLDILLLYRHLQDFFVISEKTNIMFNTGMSNLWEDVSRLGIIRSVPIYIKERGTERLGYMIGFVASVTSTIAV